MGNVAQKKPKHKVAKGAAAPDVIPEHVLQSRLMRRKKVTKRQLPIFTEAMLLLYTPSLLRHYFTSLAKGAHRGDKDSMDKIAKMYNFIPGGNGVQVNISQQMVQQNAVAGPTAPVQGFDAFARSLAEARASNILQAEAEVMELRPAEPVSVES